MIAKSFRGQKRKGETPTGFDICSTVSCLSIRRISNPVERCCSCTWHSTYSTMGPSVRAFECHNAGQQCTTCYFWGRCKNSGRLMPSPTKMRVMLDHFLRGADTPATNQRASPPAHLITDIFILTGNISSRGRGRGRDGRIRRSGWMQDPKGRQGWGSEENRHCRW